MSSTHGSDGVRGVAVGGGVAIGGGGHGGASERGMRFTSNIRTIPDKPELSPL